MENENKSRGLWEQINNSDFEYNSKFTLEKFLEIFTEQQQIRKEKICQEEKNRKEFFDYIDRFTLEELENKMASLKNRSFTIPGIGWVNYEFVIQFKKQYDNEKSRSRIV